MEEFLKILREQVGEASVVTNANQLFQAGENSLAFTRKVPAILFPKSEVDVAVIVKLAMKMAVKLYPISRGRNIGYGDKTPVKKNLVVVSLERMTKVLDLDINAGAVTIEAGVSQEQLVNYLNLNAKEWIADVTGAPPDASLVGNYLDGGFGHTPLGNHRDHILSIRAVLGNGDIIETGKFPTMGPNLSSLFVQSNFGIVTSMKIPLLRRPPVIITYTLQFQDEQKYLAALPVLRELKQLGVISSLPHFANATRIFMSTNSFPKDQAKEIRFSDEECRERLKVPLIKSPLWAGVGGLYGSRVQVNDSIKILKSKLGNYGQVKIFNAVRFKILRWLSQIVFLNSPGSLLIAHSSLSSLEDIHSLCQGIPSHRPSEHIQWRTQNKSNMGLIWICPVIRCDQKEVEKLLRIIRPIFLKYKFELPVTMTLIDNIHLVCVLNISFDKSIKDERSRAQQAYRLLHLEFKKESIICYRKSIFFQGYGIPKNRLETIKKLKRTLDPQGIIAPGRYGIWS